jgi:pimeloyl-ACP methyl ester carboxylesterase
MLQILKVSESLLRATSARGIHEYSQGLVHIQGEGTGKGPVVATGCGHDMHIEGPELVARELIELLQASSKHVQSRM